MNKHWSIDEILIKLPLISVKLKAPVIAAKESRKDSQSMVLVEGLQGIKMGFKAFNGSFVGADINRNGELAANGPIMDSWEIFELFWHPDGKVVVRACNGMFGAKLNERCQLVADRPYFRGWEKFTLKQLDDGKIAFRAANDLYVSADLDRNGELIADRPKASGWEAFTPTLSA